MEIFERLREETSLGLYQSCFSIMTAIDAWRRDSTRDNVILYAELKKKVSAPAMSPGSCIHSSVPRSSIRCILPRVRTSHRFMQEGRACIIHYEGETLRPRPWTMVGRRRRRSGKTDTTRGRRNARALSFTPIFFAANFYLRSSFQSINVGTGAITLKHKHSQWACNTPANS